MFGSLATSTGPRPPGDRWSVARNQQAHVGELVHFDFVLRDWLGRFVHPPGHGDYGVAMIGEERLECEPDEIGHFPFSHLMDRARDGETTVVGVSVFQQLGARDFIKVRGTWLQSNSPFNEPDRLIASDRIRLTFYQTVAELAIPSPADELDPETAVMHLRRTAGSTLSDSGFSNSVYQDRPDRRGFHWKDADAQGYYHVLYEPKGTEVSPTDRTTVEFSVFDRAGNRHVVATTLDTP